MIYIAVFWLTGMLKIGFIILWGRLRLKPPANDEDAFNHLECDPADSDCSPKSVKQLLADTWSARKKMYLHMITMLGTITFLVQLFINTGLGLLLCAVTTGFSMFSRVLILIWVLIFFAA